MADKKRLVLSAAHTLSNPGEVFGDLREADLTRKIVKLMVRYLEKEKIEHTLVPLDLILFKRIEWINQTGYSEDTDDILVEIHVNDGGKRGLEGWFEGDAGEFNRSQKLTEFLLKDISATTGYQNQGAKSELTHEQRSLLILNQTNTVSTAIELLYIDNDEDNKILRDEQKLDELAKAVVQAIKKYFDAKDSDPIAGAPAKKAKDSPFGNLGKVPTPQLGAGSPSAFGGNMFGSGYDPFGANSGGGLGAGIDPFGNDASTPATTGKSSSMLMDRDERKKMIIDTYQKLLGKDPKEGDVNYFLNSGITEDQLVQRIFKSKDHKQLVEDAKEAVELREKQSDLEGKTAQMKSEIQDLQNINNNLNTLMQIKNNQIAQMQNVLRGHGIVQNGEYFDYSNPQRYAKK